MKPTGRKDVLDAVLIAFLSAAAVKLVDAVAAAVERRRKKKEAAEKKTT